MLPILERNPQLLWMIVFTDETKLRLFETQVGGNVHVRCRPEERLNPENVNGSVKYGGGGITYWGCISYQGVGELRRIEGSMTGEIYSEEVLEGALWNSLIDQRMPVEEALVMEDLDPKHALRCKVSQEAAEHIGYNIIQNWPPASPDLNPIENVWGLLKRAVADLRPDSMEALDAFAQEEWAKFNNERFDLLRGLIESFPRRLQAVIDREGWYTEY